MRNEKLSMDLSTKDKAIVFESRASFILFNLLKSYCKGIVLLPANVCPIVPAVLLKGKLPFQFVDIEKESLSINEELVFDLIKKNPKKYGAVLNVRTYGNSSTEVTSFFKNVKYYNKEILTIDDCCLAAPWFENKSFSSDLEIYSTGYSKVVELGWGGYAYCKKKYRYKRECIRFKEDDHNKLLNQFYESFRKNEWKVSTNSEWLNSIKPGVSFEKYKEEVLVKREKAIEHKNIINKIYKTILPPEICLPDEFQLWRFNIIVKNPEVVLKRIFDNNFFASNHFYNVSKLFDDKSNNVSDDLSRKVVNLFNDFRVSESDAYSIGKTIYNSL